MKDQYKIQQSLSSGNDSAMARYMKLVFGRSSVTSLLKYELVNLISAKRTGALGLFLRKHMYPWIIKSVGKNVVFGSNVVVRHPHKIVIGDGVVIDDNVLIDAKGDGNSGIHLDNGVFIGRNSILSCKDGDIHLGENTNIGFNCILTSTNSVKMGRDNIVAAYTYILGGGNYQFDDIDRPIREMYDYQGKGGVSIGDNNWIGAHVTVLDGVNIENGCVIAAGSVVNQSLENDSVAMGTPAKVARKRKV